MSKIFRLVKQFSQNHVQTCQLNLGCFIFRPCKPGLNQSKSGLNRLDQFRQSPTYLLQRIVSYPKSFPIHLKSQASFPFQTEEKLSSLLSCLLSYVSISFFRERWGGGQMQRRVRIPNLPSLCVSERGSHQHCKLRLLAPWEKYSILIWTMTPYACYCIIHGHDGRA